MVFCDLSTPHGISIRAPAKGATRAFSVSGVLKLISIRAHAKGATRRQIQSLLPREDFNSRPREGGDLDAFRRDHNLEISIRAPAKGATYADLSCNG